MSVAPKNQSTLNTIKSLQILKPNNNQLKNELTSNYDSAESFKNNPLVMS